MKPLFIPLKTEYYEAFANGSKTYELRIDGPRWNRKTCSDGRPVIISKGYGKKSRSHGCIDRTNRVLVSNLVERDRSAMLKLYGLDADDKFAIVIHIKGIKPVVQPCK